MLLQWSLLKSPNNQTTKLSNFKEQNNLLFKLAQVLTLLIEKGNIDSQDKLNL